MAVDLSPVAIRVAAPRRLIQLFAGLALYGFTNAMVVRADLGLDAWNVLNQGLSDRLALPFGLVTGLVSVVVLLAWIPLRQRPGFGTIANIVVIGVVVQLGLLIIPPQHSLAWRIALLVGGIVLNGVATATYVGARLGPGARDGLMTGLHLRTGYSIRLVRTGIEVTVLIIGWLLGGTVGIGTVLYALSIGPLTQLFLRVVAYRGR
ncbi:YczE/YyaS/YitT family protein [Sciscionella sediminilitoris]|uniref:membrane protein YczE n=1 Tax=Sciscionella sediminilitoris TaxID=1445613 RepID=UPI0004DF0F13|nr:membrane protein [Sciscionella sp. SE31]